MQLIDRVIVETVEVTVSRIFKKKCSTVFKPDSERRNFSNFQQKKSKSNLKRTDFYKTFYFVFLQFFQKCELFKCIDK